LANHFAKCLILFALWPGAACGAAPPAPPRVVRVAAASDLKFALDDVVKALRAAHPDVSVQPTYGSSGNFVAQIQGGAPFDLFLSADVEYTRRLTAEGLTVPGSEFTYAVGHIVLWVARDTGIDVARGLGVLREPTVKKVAVANPRHAPYGRAAEVALKHAGVYEDVASKLVLGENVAQAAQFVQSGAADAGILALSLARAPAMTDAGRYYEIPGTAHPTLEQGGVILKQARDPEAAARVRGFLMAPAGRAILKRFGFVFPGE
jgi:molybdate transport system substrate-binding protein